MVLQINLPELKECFQTEKVNLIFDLDGTLYDFHDKDLRKSGFGQSTFYVEIKERAYSFLSKNKLISRSEAVKLYNVIKDKWNGEVSIGVEKDLGIDRYEFFENVWNLDPSDFIDANNLAPIFLDLESIGKFDISILTASPRIWTLNALKYLGLQNYNRRIFTGEPDIRKPNPGAFMNVCRTLSIRPENCISIGDQLSTDILPAKSLGMGTVFVGDSCPHADYTIKKIAEILQCCIINLSVLAFS